MEPAAITATVPKQECPGYEVPVHVVDEKQLPIGEEQLEALPDGWLQGVDMSSGRLFYYHVHDRAATSTWDRPERLNVPMAHSHQDNDDNVQGGLPDGWIEEVDVSSDKPFYYHVHDRMGTSTWDRPKMHPPLESPGALPHDEEYSDQKSEEESDSKSDDESDFCIHQESEEESDSKSDEGSEIKEETEAFEANCDFALQGCAHLGNVQVPHQFETDFDFMLPVPHRFETQFDFESICEMQIECARPGNAMQPVHPGMDINRQLQALRAAQESHVAINEILGQLSVRSENYVYFVDAHGVSAVLAVMSRHRRRCSIQEQATRVLAELVESIPAFDMMTLEEMADAFAGVILSTMRLHEDRASIQEHGCRMLAALAEKFRLNRHSTWVLDNVDAAFVGTMLDGLRRHDKVASVQDEGCRLLDVLASNDEISYSIGGGGGVEIILAALRNHHVINHTSSLGYSALANLAKNNDNRKLIRDAGGIEFVFSDMKNDTFKLVIGCPLLVVLAEADDIAALIKASDGFQGILNEIRNAQKISFRDPKGVLRLRFSKKGNAISTMIVEAGGIGVILSGIQNTEIRDKSHLIRSLAMLTTNDEIASRVDIGGNDAIWKILALNGSHDYQSLLFFLSRNDEIAKLIVESGAFDTILTEVTDTGCEHMARE